ncbi:septal ring lytic transglycosylase RlpA family protein [Beijerinckia sp. L45]|uniref:septal ring lytic transglycosylase RlpA family protein n=1 Tax=Beijerinckia sp. L45 TaxID=1641855 RepID=UPI00131DA0E4|nr:septal ring lytic transglycosylase RlpA family protein [Beijerinckia sp. L45]
MCVALAVAGFIASNASASAARFAHSHRTSAHRAIGPHHGLRAVHAGERHAGRLGRRARFAGHVHHRGLYAAAHRHGVARLARRLVDAPVGSFADGGGQTGKASFYSGSHRTANGGFVGAATCAHRTLPFGTRVLVTNLSSGRQAVLTVNDRGPFVRGRIVDVSRGAASTLGMIGAGTASVRVQVVSRSAEGSVW